MLELRARGFPSKVEYYSIDEFFFLRHVPMRGKTLPADRRERFAT